MTNHLKQLNDAAAALMLHQVWEHLAGVQAQRRKIFRASGFLLICLAPFLSSIWTDDTWVHLSIEWVGLVLILVAVLGRCWCILYLGGHKGAHLIQQGPYSVSRNPLYLFSMLAVAGIGAQSGSLVLGLVMALFVYAVFNNVIEEEERLLRLVFGAEYDVYRARVPRLAPRFTLWKVEEGGLMISLSALGHTVRDALPYFLALPLFELIEAGQDLGWLPVLIHLP